MATTPGKSPLPTGRHSVASTCEVCGVTFCGVEAFDAHRVGPFGDEFAAGRYRVSKGRRCFKATEVYEKFRKCELGRLVLA